MATYPPPSPLHLPPRRRLIQERVLPLKLRLALALDHLRNLGVDTEELRELLESGLRNAPVSLSSSSQAEGELERLVSMTPEQRVREIESASSEAYGSVELAELFGRRAAKVLPGNPKASLHWAQLCGLVARRGSTVGHKEWRAHRLFLTANALRAEGDRTSAAEYFGLAVLESRTAPPVAISVIAERFSFMCSQALDNGNLGGALEAAARSAALGSLAGDHALRVRALLGSAAAHFRAGRFGAASAHDRSAVSGLTETAEPLLTLAAESSLAIDWARRGIHDLARGAFRRAERLFELFPENAHLQLRRRWLAAEIAAGLGEKAEAVAAYEDTLMGFMENGWFSDAVQVALSLVVLLTLDLDEAGLGKLAEEVVPRLEETSADGKENLRLRTVLRIVGRAAREPGPRHLRLLVRSQELLLRSSAPKPGQFQPT